MKCLASLALLLAGCGTTALPAQPDEPITFTIESWGTAFGGWTMKGDGSIARWELAERPDGKVLVERAGQRKAYERVTRNTPPDAARRQWLADLLAPIRARAGRPPDCGNRITDLTYGTMQWGSGATPVVLRFDSGCEGKDAQAVMKTLIQADRQVGIWIDKATPAPAAAPSPASSTPAPVPAPPPTPEVMYEPAPRLGNVAAALGFREKLADGRATPRDIVHYLDRLERCQHERIPIHAQQVSCAYILNEDEERLRRKYRRDPAVLKVFDSLRYD